MKKYIISLLAILSFATLLIGTTHAAPFSISVATSTLTTVTDTSILGSMSGATYQNAGFVGALAIDLKATVLSFSQNNGTGAIIFAKSGDDPSVRVTSGHAVIKWEVFEAGTSNPAYGDVDFTISDLDAYSVQNLGAIGVVNIIPVYPIESVSADLTGLYSYSSNNPTNISFTNDGTKVKAANLISNQSGEPQSTVKFSWKNISTWQLNYDVENPPVGNISYDQSPFDMIIDGTFTLQGFGQRFFNNDGDGDLNFVSAFLFGIPQIDLDGDNSTSSGTTYQNTFLENGSGVTIVDADISITHASSATLSGATIQITNKQNGDILTAGTFPSGISASSYNPLTGILTLSGLASLADYKTALQSILFSNTTHNPGNGDRNISISIFDGVNSSDKVISTIHVSPSNDLPIAGNDALSVGQNISSEVLDLLGNDSDLDGDTLTIKSIEGELLTPGTAQSITTTNGTVYVSASGSITFVSNPGFSGTTNFVYVVQDGNSGEASGTVNVNVIAPPSSPIVTNPASTSSGSSTTPTITGTGTVGDTVRVLGPLGETCTSIVDMSGNWSCTISPSLPQGTSILSVTAANLPGNNSTPTQLTLFIDSLAPTAPTVTNIAGDTTSTYLSNSFTPTITGIGEINSTITIMDGSGSILGTTITDALGNWTFTPTLALAEGLNSLTATSTDVLGNVSSPLSLPIHIDTIAPVTPTLVNPIEGLITNNPTSTINGIGEAGSVFELRDSSNTLIGTGVVDPSGNYSFTPISNLPEGANTLSVTLTDAAGNMSPALVRNFTVDTTAPTPLTIISPINNSLTNDATPTINGTGEAGSIFEVRDTGGNLVGTGVVDGSGNWSLEACLPTQQTTTTTSISYNIQNFLLSTFAIEATYADGCNPFPEGNLTFSVTLTDGAGNTGSPVQTTFIIDSIAPSTSSSALDLQASSDSGNSNTDNTTSDTTPSFDVLCNEVGSTIRIYSGTQVLTSYICLTTGINSVTLTSTLSDGVYTLHYTETDPAGNQSGISTTLQFTIDSMAPATLTGNMIPSDDSGLSNTDNITNNTTPTLTGTGEIGSIVRIVVAANTYTGVVDSTGNWSLELTSPLPDGVYTLQMTQTDSSGNISALANTQITLDTIVPDTIFVSSLGVNIAGSIIAINTSIQVVFQSNNTGSLFECAFNNEVYTICASPFSYTPISPGSYTLQIRSVDTAGNRDLTPVVLTFNVQSNTGGGGGSVSSSSQKKIVSEVVSEKNKDKITDTSFPLPVIPGKSISEQIPQNTDTPIKNIETIEEQDIFINTPVSKKIVSTDILPTQVDKLKYIATLPGTKLPIFELKNRVTDYICPIIVKVNNAEDLLSEESTGDTGMQSVLMFRGLEKGEDTGEATFIEAKDQGIAKNVIVFDANRDVTRAEYVKMIVRSLSCRYTYLGTDTGFSDVEENTWYAPYIKFAVENGWINGYEDGNFRPNNPITKEEATKILARAIQLPIQQGNGNFSDVDRENIFAKYINSLKDTSIITQSVENKFYPGEYIKRRESADLIYRTFLGGLE